MPRPAVADRAAPIRRLVTGALLYGALALGANAETRAGEAIDPAFDAMVVHEAPKERIETPFEDAGGRTMTLADFEGEVVVLNVWATWCPPCRKEMPSLDRLAETVAGEDIRVVALSVDRSGVPKVEDFFEEIGVETLEIYVDTANALPREALVRGLPVTMILDRQGREVARLTGDAEWDAPAVVEMLRGMAARTAGG